MFTAPSSAARTRAPMLFTLLALLPLLLVTACPPRPPSPNGPVSTPSSWVDTTRTVLTTLRWAVPAARIVVDAFVSDPGRTQVDRALDAVTEAAGRLDTALAAYEARGGDRCPAKAAVAGVREALVGAAQVLADNGVALGLVFERVVDTAAALVDELVPGCDPDAGWSSTGRATNGELRAIELRASARGLILRRDLDSLHPPADAGAR